MDVTLAIPKAFAKPNRIYSVVDAHWAKGVICPHLKKLDVFSRERSQGLHDI